MYIFFLTSDKDFQRSHLSGKIICKASCRLHVFQRNYTATVYGALSAAVWLLITLKKFIHDQETSWKRSSLPCTYSQEEIKLEWKMRVFFNVILERWPPWSLQRGRSKVQELWLHFNWIVIIRQEFLCITTGHMMCLNPLELHRKVPCEKFERNMICQVEAPPNMVL